MENHAITYYMTLENLLKNYVAHFCNFTDQKLMISDDDYVFFKFSTLNISKNQYSQEWL